MSGIDTLEASFFVTVNIYNLSNSGDKIFIFNP